MPHDVFISYAHWDNKLESDEDKGWVSSFYQSLEFHLGVQLGQKPNIWVDWERMHGGDFLTRKVLNNLYQSSTLICIISPPYINSEWCRKELESFRENVGYRLNDEKSRVFFVIKNRINTQPAYEIFNDLDLLYDEFFEVRRGIPHTLPPTSDAFKDKVVTLAFKINEVLSELKTETATRKTIYLAETTRDLRAQHERIRKDLNRTYTILPSSFVDMPSDAEGYQAAVREQLEKCDLAVHIIGRNYGDPLEGSNSSFVHLQTEAAFAHARENPDFATLIWLPENVEPEKKEFLNELLTSVSKKIDVFRDVSEEKLKTRILDILEGKTDDETPLSGRKYVYVYCEKQDAQAVKDLENILYDELGCEIYSASDYLSQKTENGEQDDFLKEAEKYVKKSHGVLVYWGTPFKFWVQASVQVLRESLGEKPLGIFLANQQSYRTRDAKFINNHTALREFVANLDLGGNGNAG